MNQQVDASQGGGASGPRQLDDHCAAMPPSMKDAAFGKHLQCSVGGMRADTQPLRHLTGSRVGAAGRRPVHPEFLFQLIRQFDDSCELLHGTGRQGLPTHASFRSVSVGSLPLVAGTLLKGIKFPALVVQTHYR